MLKSSFIMNNNYEYVFMFYHFVKYGGSLWQSQFQQQNTAG